MKILSSIWSKVKGFWQWFQKASWKKKIATSIGILILLIILKNIFFPSNKTPYTFDTVTYGTINQLVTETGNVISSNETDVFSPTTGSIDQVYVANGESVNQGDKLFTVRSTATAQEQAVAYANYLTAQAALNADTAQLNTLQSTMFVANQNFVNDKGVNNPTDQQKSDPKYIEEDATWLAAEANYKNQQAVIQKDQAALNSASLAYQATQNATVTAPIAGTVSNLIGLTGAKVVAQISSAATSSTTTSTTTSSQVVTPVLVIGSTGMYAIHTAVSEVDINKIAIGEHVNATFGAIPNKMYSGKVIQEDTFGTNTGGVITYNVFIAIENGDPEIKPNMSANLTIATAQRQNVLTVANGAIIPYRNGKAVQVLGKNGKVMFVPVVIGLHGFTRSEVLKGITQGTKVILGNTTIQNNQNGGPNSQG